MHTADARETLRPLAQNLDRIAERLERGKP